MPHGSVTLSIWKGPSQNEMQIARKKGMSVYFKLANRQTYNVFPKKISFETDSTASFVFYYDTKLDSAEITLKGYCDYRRGALKGWMEVLI